MGRLDLQLGQLFPQYRAFHGFRESPRGDTQGLSGDSPQSKTASDTTITAIHSLWIHGYQRGQRLQSRQWVLVCPPHREVRRLLEVQRYPAKGRTKQLTSCQQKKQKKRKRVKHEWGVVKTYRLTLGTNVSLHTLNTGISLKQMQQKENTIYTDEPMQLFALGFLCESELTARPLGPAEP